MPNGIRTKSRNGSETLMVGTMFDLSHQSIPKITQNTGNFDPPYLRTIWVYGYAFCRKFKLGLPPVSLA